VETGLLLVLKNKDSYLFGSGKVRLMSWNSRVIILI